MPNPGDVATATKPHRALEEKQASRWLMLAVLCSSILIINLDTTVLNVALPTLVRQLHATSSQLQWVVDAYALVLGGLVLVAGSVADRVGRKWTFLAGLLLFAGGSSWAAFSGSVDVLIAARASMGVGAALLMPSTLSTITNVFRDPAERQSAIGIWAGTSGVGFALGPLVGGLLLAHFWWGSVFLINVPIALVAIAFAVPIIPNSKNLASLPPDLSGALFSIFGVGLILWAVIEAPVDGWSSAVVLATICSGVVVLVGFAWWEATTAHPLLNVAYFRQRGFSGAVSTVGLAMFGLVGALFMLTQYLQFNLGYSALQAGVRMLPIAAILAIVAPSSAVSNRVFGTKLTTAGGLLVIAVGLFVVSRGSIGWGYANLLPGMLLIGIGAALVLPSVSASVMNSVRSGDTGVGSATNGACIQIGGALGVAVIGSLLSTRYQDRMRSAIAPYHVPNSVAHTILGSIGGALSVAQNVGGTTGALLAHAARLAFISGSDLGLIPAACVALGGCVLALIVLPKHAQPPHEDENASAR